MTAMKLPPKNRVSLGAQAAGERVVTVRELEKNTAAVLRELTKTASPLRVTNRGRLTAWLVPLSPEDLLREELIATGELRSVGPGSLAGWSPLPPLEGESVTDTLLAMREEDER
jgi:antitoxin (DNA-binding transcriptional repressor) of toxin-antitoxin stability system